MAARDSGTSNVAIIAILVLVVIGVGALIYFLSGSKNKTTTIEKPDFHIEAPKLPSPHSK